MTLPQMFFHPKDTWIGGHQQPCGMRQVVMNHGPGEIEWTIIASEEVPLLEEKLGNLYDLEMFRNEGMWYLNYDVLMANNIPCYTVIQKEGDAIVLGPGTLCMRRALDL